MRAIPQVSEFVDGICCEQRRRTGTYIGSQAKLHAMRHQVEQVRTLERIAAGEDHQRVSEFFHLIQQAESIECRQFVCVPAGLG